MWQGVKMFGVNGFEFHTQGLMEQLERSLKSDKSVSNQDAERIVTLNVDLDKMIPLQEVKWRDPQPDDARYKA
jgi:hypothetical protein